jgi:fructose-bisphosphate aldolase (EC 4.1.2.13)
MSTIHQPAIEIEREICMTATLSVSNSIESWLGDEAEDLLSHQAKISQDLLHLPGPDWVDRIFAQTDRVPQVLRSLQQLYSSGRLANTGYLSILPVDQGSNTLPPLLLHRILSILTAKISLN